MLKINRRRIIPLLYCISLLGFFLIVLLVLLTRTAKPNNTIFKSPPTISGEWYLKDGTSPISLSKLGSYMDEATGTLSIYHQLPDSMDVGLTLFYRSKDVYTSVLIDNDPLYQTEVKSSPFYNRSPGNLWNSVFISKSHQGKTIELQIKMVYDTSAITVDHTYLGDKADIINSIVRAKGWGLTISLFVILIGIILIVFNFLPFYYKISQNNSYFYLGLYSLLMGLYSLFETNILQIYLYDGRIVQLLDNICMIVDTFPLILYVNAYHNLFKRRVFRIYGHLQLLYLFACVFCQLSGFADLHNLLKISWFFSYASNFIFLCFFIKLCVNSIKKKEINTEQLLQFIGFLFMMVTTLFSVTHYTMQDSMDRATYLRPGILLFVICFTASTLMSSFRLLSRGLRYDILKDLALRDGLTGLYNRSAYLDKLEELKNSPNCSFGIIMLDVNNLKQGNDTYGHTYGDLMIKTAAQVISDSFGPSGTVYRTGGDEFCVIMECNDLSTQYKISKLRFHDNLKFANEINDFKKTLQIAHGVAFCNQPGEDRLQHTIDFADQMMYQDKEMLKQYK